MILCIDPERIKEFLDHAPTPPEPNHTLAAACNIMTDEDGEQSVVLYLADESDGHDVLIILTAPEAMGIAIGLRDLAKQIVAKVMEN